MKHPQPPKGYRSWLAWFCRGDKGLTNAWPQAAGARELRALMALLRTVDSARLRHILPLDTYAAIGRCTALGLTRRRRR